MGGWLDFLRWALGWASAPQAAPAPLVVWSVQGRRDATYSVVGGAMSKITRLGCHRAEDVQVTVTVPEDITAKSLTLALLSGKSGTVLVEHTVGAGVTVTDGPGGVAVGVFASADTDQQAGDYYWEFCDSTSGSKAVLAEGPFPIYDPRAL